MKHCRKCDTMKSLEDFHKDKRSTSGRTSYCKECQKAKSRNWHKENSALANERTRKRIKENPNTWRDSNYRRKYEITLAEYNDMLADQGGVCKVCGQLERRVATENLAVDHCHTTGVVRGLLCSNCNRALGLLNDDISVVQSLVQYLK